MFSWLFDRLVRIFPSLYNPRQPLYLQRLGFGSVLLAILVFSGGLALLGLTVILVGLNWITNNPIAAGLVLPLWGAMCMSIPIFTSMYWLIRRRPQIRRLLQEGDSACEHCLHRIKAATKGPCPECGISHDAAVSRERWKAQFLRGRFPEP